MAVMNFRINDELKNQFQCICKENGISMSFLLTRFIRRFSEGDFDIAIIEKCPSGGMADTADLKSAEETHEGSSPSSGTKE